MARKSAGNGSLEIDGTRLTLAQIRAFERRRPVVRRKAGPCHKDVAAPPQVRRSDGRRPICPGTLAGGPAMPVALRERNVMSFSKLLQWITLGALSLGLGTSPVTLLEMVTAAPGGKAQRAQ